MVERAHRTAEWHAAAAAVAGCVALAVAMGIGRFAFTPILPMMQQDAAVSVTDGGWLAAANYFGYLIGALSAIVLRVRILTAIRAALIVIGVATAGMGLTDCLAAWVLLRALAGFASAWVLIFVSAWCLEKNVLLRRPMLNGIVFAGVGAGIAGVGMLCILLMRAQVSSGQTWIVVGGLSLLLSLAVLPVFAADDDILCEKRPAALGALRPNRVSTRLIFCYGVFGFGYIIPATFLPVMARQIVADPAIFGWCWPVFGAAALASTLAAATLGRSIGNRRLWIISQLLMAFGVMLPMFARGIAAVTLSALLVGGTFMVVTMAAMQEAREVGGRHAAGLMAAMTAAFAAGQVAGPLCAGYMAGADGNFSTALLLAGSLLAVSACALSLPERWRSIQP